MSIALGERLRNLRKARGLSQEELARRTNIGVKAYGDLERGRTLDPHYSTLEGLAHALGITVVELVGEESEPVLAGPKADAPQEEAGHRHRRTQRDSIPVDDTVKRTLEPQFNALISALKTNGLSEKATELERMRDEILAA
jgi:transcriptional regulator with XRE-family HTH domain